MYERGHRAGSLECVDAAVGLGLGIEVARIEIRRRIRDFERTIGSEATVGAVRRIARIEDDIALAPDERERDHHEHADHGAHLARHAFASALVA